jgi:hypothetical protein
MRETDASIDHPEAYVALIFVFQRQLTTSDCPNREGANASVSAVLTTVKNSPAYLPCSREPKGRKPCGQRTARGNHRRRLVR